MKKILCYGDSNTWGYSPADGSRFDKNIRWPGVMGENLSSEYLIIEEGLNGRSAIDLYPYYHNTNGIEYISSTIDKYMPVDMALIFLGMNDIFAAPSEPLWKISSAIMEIADIISQAHIKNKLSRPVIIIMGLPEITSDIEDGEFYQMAINKADALSGHLNESASTKNYLFVNTSSVIQTSPLDGTHLSSDSHIRLGEYMADLIKKVLL